MWDLVWLIGSTFFSPCHNFSYSQLEGGLTIPVQFWQSCIWSLVLELSSQAVHCFPSRTMLSTRGMPCPKGFLRPAAALKCWLLLWPHTLGAGWRQMSSLPTAYHGDKSLPAGAAAWKGRWGSYSWIWNIRQRFRLALYGRKKAYSLDSKIITKRILASQGQLTESQSSLSWNRPRRIIKSSS